MNPKHKLPILGITAAVLIALGLQGCFPDPQAKYQNAQLRVGMTIYQIKQRDARKPFSFICADLSDVARYAHVSNFAFKILKRHLPGPYTFVLEATRIVPDSLVTRQKTVGIRIPDDPIALAIVHELGHPLVTTSANIAGEEPLHDPVEIDRQLGRQLDLVIDGGIRLGHPSTIISLLDDRLEVLREGSGDTSWIHQL